MGDTQTSGTDRIVEMTFNPWEDALRQIVRILGPSPDPTLEGATEGMAAEIDEALRIAYEALGGDN